MPRRLPAIATEIACVPGRDRWRGLFVESHLVPQPNGHILVRTAAPAVAGFFELATDSVLKLKWQSADRRAGPPPDNRSRTARGHPPHCTECRGLAPRHIRTHSDHEKMLPPQPGKHYPNPKAQNHDLRVQFRRFGPTRARLRSSCALPRVFWRRSVRVRESWARRLVRRRPPRPSAHPVSRTLEIDSSCNSP